MNPQPQPPNEPRILRIFISYASEDLKIAHALARGLSDALPEGFAEVCFDKWFLQAGAEFKKEIESKLEKTDVFIIVYTGVDKHSHSFTGWEVGYFERVKLNDPNRKIIPMYIEDLPSTAAEFEGLSLRIPRKVLQMAVDEFAGQNDVPLDDPLCTLIAELQDKADEIKHSAGYAKTSSRDRNDPVLCVKNMRLAIFTYLKTTVETVLKPQKQITIKSTGAALQQSDSDLPGDAKLVPVGGAAMSIFGIGDDEMTWEEFLQKTAGPHSDSWREAITSVIISSQAERIDVDNSQIILSSDDSKTYRIVLTTATKYWDDCREFNLYFVETLRREEYGDHDSTLILKGLEVSCRYRFMFLESSSQYSANAFLATREERLREISVKLLRELNVMRKEATNAGLDQPAIWSRFVDWSLIMAIGDAFRSKEKVLREVLGQVLNPNNQRELATLRQELAQAVRELEDATREPNAKLIEALSKKMLALVQARDSAATGLDGA
jgi:hypothetical protein